MVGSPNRAGNMNTDVYPNFDEELTTANLLKTAIYNAHKECNLRDILY